MRQRRVRLSAGPQEGQDVYIEVVVEAAGAVEQIYRTTSAYGVPVYSGSGFVPVTALRDIVLRAERREVPTVVLVLGDYDPAGRYIRERVAADIEAFAADHDVDIEVETIALVEAQDRIARSDPRTDGRAQAREVPDLAARVDGSSSRRSLRPTWRRSSPRRSRR
jgi:hypothetical protein